MKYVTLLLLVLPLAATAQKTNWWQEFPSKPDNYVTDQEDYLSPREKDLLNAKLRAFEDSTSNQVFVYLAKSLRGKGLEDLSKKIFNTWGIGQKDKNNGVLIAVFIDDRQYRIQVGYGLEGVLPSALTLEIQDDVMRSHFREKNYYQGIDAGVDQLIFYTKHEFTPKDPNQNGWIAVFVAAAISVLFCVINLLSLKKWKNQPKRWKKFMLLNVAFLFIPLLGPAVYTILHSTNFYLLCLPSFAGTLATMILCTLINDKEEIRYDHETDDAYLRRMHQRASRESSSSNDSFSGGGGGSSGSGGSSSTW